MSVIGDSSKMISNERFRTQEKILKSGRFFKFICGAGNEDPEEVYKLCLVYTLAGAKSIDISATVGVVQSTIRAINDAEKLLDHFKVSDYVRPFITVSVGMAGDHHVRKAHIISTMCTKCNACIPVCPTDAIPDSLIIIENRCIGCGACGVACQDDAIGYNHKEIELKQVLFECVEAGAENIELHAAVPDHDQTIIEWKVINEILPKGFLSICLDRAYLSNFELRKRIELLLDLSPNRLIVQADGTPMSGGRDDYNTTLQAIATADIVSKLNLPVHILLSGGTNSKSIELSKLSGVPTAGVSIGTFARHLVYEYINDSKFPDMEVLEPAVEKAKRLVSTCI
jgi:Fe-S-cluster-containing hydrogenase component 2